MLLGRGGGVCVQAVHAHALEGVGTKSLWLRVTSRVGLNFTSSIISETCLIFNSLSSYPENNLYHILFEDELS